jgi:hypothetical protein
MGSGGSKKKYTPSQYPSDTATTTSSYTADQSNAGTVPSASTNPPATMPTTLSSRQDEKRNSLLQRIANKMRTTTTKVHDFSPTITFLTIISSPSTHFDVYSSTLLSEVMRTISCEYCFLNMVDDVREQILSCYFPGLNAASSNHLQPYFWVTSMEDGLIGSCGKKGHAYNLEDVRRHRLFGNGDWPPSLRQYTPSSYCIQPIRYMGDKTRIIGSIAVVNKDQSNSNDNDNTMNNGAPAFSKRDAMQLLQICLQASDSMYRQRVRAIESNGDADASDILSHYDRNHQKHIGENNATIRTSGMSGFTHNSKTLNAPQDQVTPNMGVSPMSKHIAGGGKGKGHRVSFTDRSMGKESIYQATFQDGPLGIKLNVHPKAMGCVVHHVEVNSQSYDQHIQTGDQILKVGAVKVTNAKDAMLELKQQPRPIVLTLQHKSNAQREMKENGEKGETDRAPRKTLLEQTRRSQRNKNRNEASAKDLLVYSWPMATHGSSSDLVRGYTESDMGVPLDFRTLEFSALDYSGERLERFVLSIMRDTGMVDMFSIPPARLIRWTRAVRSSYHEANPFHNWYHGFSVFHFSYYQLYVTDIPNFLHPLDVFGLLIAALCHDSDHPGLNNQHLIDSENDLSIHYNDVSVLENHHAYICCELLRNENTKICCYLDPMDQKELRKIIITAILHTDMSKHNKTCQEIMNRDRLRPFRSDRVTDRQTLINICIHCSDLSAQVLPWVIASRWEERIAQEFGAQAKKETALGMKPSPIMVNLDDMKVRGKGQMGK